MLATVISKKLSKKLAKKLAKRSVPRSRKAPLIGQICLCLLILAELPLRAQQPPQDPAGTQDPKPQRLPGEGQIVRDILIEPASESKADLILRLLRTKVGEPLERARIAQDEEALWTTLNYLTNIEVEEVDGGVRVFYVVQSSQAFDQFEFKGLDHFKESDVRALLGIGPRKRMNQLTAEQYAANLEARYQLDGFAFARVRLESDEQTNKLTFFVDEGTEVEVGEVFFRGNETFPGDNPWYWFFGEVTLLDKAGIKSQPSGLFSGSPYSVEIVEDDLESLRFFYRSRGFRDANVELAGRRFFDDFSKVDLTFRIIEGPRYKIASVDLEQIPPSGQSEPLYPKDQVLAEVKTKAGDFYSYDLILRDNVAIENFYGKRGHPPASRYGRNLENAFETLDPLELIDYEDHEIQLTFRLREGTPKMLRDVKILGNQFTEDRVIRRRILVFPGEIIDIPKIQRSINSLDSLRYFLDPEDFSGVRFELAPVAGEPDVVDLAVEVSEGDTGQFVWGAGLSTGAGFQGRFQFIKRNFDITNLPSTWSPFGVIGEVAGNEAFHGAGQELELVLAPGTEISLFQVRFSDPDIFRRHIDTIGLGVDGFRNITFRDTYEADSLGVQVSLSRNFTEHTSVTVSFLQQTTDISDIDANAPTIVWNDEGKTEMRGPRIDIRYSDLDFPLQPSTGFDLRAYYEVIGGPFGGQTNFFTTGVGMDYYIPLYRDSLDRNHVLYLRNRFDFGQAFRQDHDLYVNNRWVMGGSNLRGFDQRKAGPTQFGEPLGGEARYLAGAEYRFPLVSNRSEGGLREQEFLRGVVFTDFGLLGTRLNDSSFREPRLSLGFGLRIAVPLLGVPIALDLAWPMLKEDTDEQRQFFFSLSR